MKDRLLTIQSFVAVVRAGRTGPLNQLQREFLDTALDATRDIEPLIDEFDRFASCAGTATPASELADSLSSS